MQKDDSAALLSRSASRARRAREEEAYQILYEMEQRELHEQLRREREEKAARELFFLHSPLHALRKCLLVLLRAQSV